MSIFYRSFFLSIIVITLQSANAQPYFQKAIWKGVSLEIVKNEVCIDRTLFKQLPDSLIRKYGVRVRYIGKKWAVLTTSLTSLSLIKKIHQYGINRVEPNIVCTAERINKVLPSDPLFSTQWNLSNQTDGGIGWIEAWNDIAPGTHTVKGGIIDSGIPLQQDSINGTLLYHSDFDFNHIIYGKDFSYEARVGATALYDGYGHGTAVAGVVNAITNNGIGIAGLLNEFPYQLYIDKIWDKNGKGTSAQLVDALYHLINEGVRVINFSGTVPVYSEMLEEAIADAREYGVIIVASTGNYNESTPRWPAYFSHYGEHEHDGYKNVIGVGSIWKDGKRSYFSNYGNGTTVMAPGELIPVLSPFYKSTLGQYWQQWYATAIGTSFSAPHVFGLIIMLLSYDPSITYYEIRSLLIETSDQVGNVLYQQKENGYFHPEYGFGRINIVRALTKIKKLTKQRAQPQQMVLYQNYPNPFQIGTAIRYELNRASPVALYIYDSIGRRIATLVNEEQRRGTYTVRFIASQYHLASGVYFCRVRAGAYTTTKKMVILKK
ncbi:MAG: S8 family peptidase [Parcubacteria group bacterium]|nr:S8 family peptidase [Parcubacteria group bacterium]